MEKFIQVQLIMRGQPSNDELVQSIILIINAWNSKNKSKNNYEAWTMPWNGGTCLYPERCRTGMYIPRFDCNHTGDCPQNDEEEEDDD